MGSKSTDALHARKAWEKCHGKKCPAGMVVAHKNNDPTDNSCSNLLLVTRGRHNRMTKKGKTLKEQTKGVKNKPNIGTEDGLQRRYRGKTKRS